MEGSLTDVVSSLSTIESLLQTTAATKQWESMGSSAVREMSNYVIPLYKHIEGSADELQDRAEKCSQ